MDTLIFALVLNLHPAIAEFANSLSLQETVRHIENKNAISQFNQTSLTLNLPFKTNDGVEVAGEVVAFANVSPGKFLLYIQSDSADLWTYMQDAVYSNYKNAKYGDVQLKPSVVESNYFSFEPFYRDSYLYKMSITVDKKEVGTTSVVIVIKITEPDL